MPEPDDHDAAHYLGECYPGGCSICRTDHADTEPE